MKYVAVSFVALFAAFIATLTAMVCALPASYALTILWGWFVAPVFNLPLLTFPQVLGLLVTLSLFKENPMLALQDETDKTPEDPLVWIKLFGIAFLVPATVLGLGFVIKLSSGG